MIKYRPHRGILIESMDEAKEFDTTDRMYDYILKDWNTGYIFFGREDLSISEDFGRDERINWNECRYVCTKRIGKDRYDIP